MHYSFSRNAQRKKKHHSVAFTVNMILFIPYLSLTQYLLFCQFYESFLDVYWGHRSEVDGQTQTTTRINGLTVPLIELAALLGP